MKIEKVTESDSLELYKFVETNLIVAVIDKDRKVVKIVHRNTVIEEYHGIENAEDVEKITEEKKLDITLKAATVIAMMNIQKTK